MSINSNPSSPADPILNPVVHRPQPARQASDLSAACGLPTIHDIESSVTLSPSTSVSHSVEHDPANPCSAFYSHPQTRYSLEAQRSETKPIIDITDADVEACRSANHGRCSAQKYVAANRTKDC